MDVININNGQFKVDDMGQVFVNHNMIYSPYMIDSKIICQMAQLQCKFDELNYKLNKSNETIKALMYILVEKSIIKKLEDVDEIIQEIKDSNELIDKLVEVSKNG